MKFHLPKKLLVAVLAAMTIHTTQAGYYTIGGVIGVDADGNPVSGTIKPSDIPVADTSKISTPIAKDGSGTLTIDEDGALKQDLFIREGQFVIKAHFTSIHFLTDTLPGSHYTKGHPGEGSKGKLDGMMHLSIAGKNAVMIIDGEGGTTKTDSQGHTYAASYISNAVEYGSHVNIGGVNGNGKLIVQNHAYFSNEGGWSSHIGYSAEQDETDYQKLGCHVVHASTATTDGKYENIADRYIGNYTPGSMDSSQYFGKGEVYVKDNSYIHFGAGTRWYNGIGDTNGLFMGEALLSIDNSSTGETRSAYFGTHSGALSEIMITNESNLNMSKYLYTGIEKSGITVHNAKVVINIDNKSNISAADQVNLSTNGTNTTTTELTLTNNSTAKFGKLTVGSESGNSTAEVNIDATSTVEAYDSTKSMDLTINHAQVNNAGKINAGNVEVNNGGTLSMTGSAATLNAKSVTVKEGGVLQAGGGSPVTLASDTVTVAEGGIISLEDGSFLNVDAITLKSGAILNLSGGYASGDVLIVSNNLIDEGVTVTMDNGVVNYTLDGSTLYITSLFDNNIADAMVQANWGNVTASRAFVHAVRGQRTNTGCIADGRGTAWAAVLGAYNDLDGGDVNLKGAAVGADMKVGNCSSVGMAIGYLDGEVSPTGLSDVDQEGTYVALYGEHGLGKLSATSCLSLDWVVAYGQTESKYQGMSWEQDSLQLNSRLSWNKQLSERLGLRVFGGLEYFTNDSDTVNGIETGSIDNLRGELGVGVDYVAWGMPSDEKGAALAGSGCKRLVLHGELRYFNDLDRENPVVEMDGLRGGGENPGRSGVGMDVGATYRINDRWSTSANYSYSTMDGSTEHRLNVGASYTF